MRGGSSRAVRAQYHARPGPDGRRVWDVRRLVELARDLPVEQVPLDHIRELDETYWYGNGEVPTVRSVARHMHMVEAVDPAWPVILCAEGRVMDGMHRIVRALLEGRRTIAARRFAVTPDPDHVGVELSELPYDD